MARDYSPDFEPDADLWPDEEKLQAMERAYERSLDRPWGDAPEPDYTNGRALPPS